MRFSYDVKLTIGVWAALAAATWMLGAWYPPFLAMAKVWVTVAIYNLGTVMAVRYLGVSSGTTDKDGNTVRTYEMGGDVLLILDKN